MPISFLNAVVRLTHDVPMLGLGCGDVGVVQSTWMSPATWYEIEFCKPGHCAVRALLNASLFEIVNPAPSIAGGERETAKHE